MVLKKKPQQNYFENVAFTIASISSKPWATCAVVGTPGVVAHGVIITITPVSFVSTFVDI